MTDEERAEAIRAAWLTGRDHMLRQILAEAETFEALMKRRRYFNNANGIRRFAEYLKAKLAEETQ